MPLTKRTIDAARFDADGPATQIIPDDALPGFGIRLYPSGRKAFLIRYRTMGGRSRNYTIGQYGIFTVEEARMRARRLLVEIADGSDPVAERKRERAGLTVSAFADLYLEQYAKPKKRAASEDERRIKKRIKPALGTYKLPDVTRADVEALHVAVGKDGPTEANRVITLIGRMFQLAVEWGHLPEGHRNPARGIKRYPEQKRRRFLTPEELPRLIEALNDEPSPYVRAAVLLILLTGCRKSELLAARWEDIDFSRRMLRLRDTKAGEAQEVPLSAPALELLGMIPRLADNPWIFPSSKGGHMTTFNKPWAKIRKAAKLPDLTIHDLRRTVGSWMATGGASQALVGEVLRQRSPSVTAIYTRIAPGSAAAALEDHGSQVLEVTGELRIENEA